MKTVTVDVHDGSSTANVLITESSTFDHPPARGKRDGCIHIRGDQRPGARELGRRPRAGHDRGDRAAPGSRSAGALALRAGGDRRGRPALEVQEGQAEVAPGLRAPAGDDDRGRRQRRRRARHARGADGRQVPGRDDRRGTGGRRVGAGALAGAGAASEGLQPALHLDGRGGRVVGHARRGARPRRDADREGDAAEAARARGDDLPGRRPQLRDARAHLHAPLHRPGLRRGVRDARRRPAGADEARHGHVEPAP